MQSIRPPTVACRPRGPACRGGPARKPASALRLTALAHPGQRSAASGARRLGLRGRTGRCGRAGPVLIPGSGRADAARMRQPEGPAPGLGLLLPKRSGAPAGVELLRRALDQEPPAPQPGRCLALVMHDHLPARIDSRSRRMQRRAWVRAGTRARGRSAAIDGAQAITSAGATSNYARLDGIMFRGKQVLLPSKHVNPIYIIELEQILRV